MGDEIPPPAQVALDAEGRVAGDLACIQCEYNLRTLHKDAKCPECGTPLRHSLRGDWLRYADTAWLAQIARGMNLIVVTLFLAMIGLILSLLGFLFASALHGEANDAIRATVKAVVALTVLIAGAGVLVGLLFLTKPEPNRPLQGSRLNSRRFGRLLVGATLVAILVNLLLDIRSSTLAVLRPTVPILWMALCAAVSYYIRKLALRIPDRHTAHVAGALFTGFWIPIGVTVMLGTSLWRASGAPGWVMLMAGAALSIIVFIMYITLLGSFRRTLNHIARKAREVEAEAGRSAASEQEIDDA